MLGQKLVYFRKVLEFDIEAARRYASLAVKASTARKGFPVPDGYIAAIVAAKGFQVALRDAGKSMRRVCQSIRRVAHGPIPGRFPLASILHRERRRLIPVPIAFQIGL